MTSCAALALLALAASPSNALQHHSPHVAIHSTSDTYGSSKCRCVGVEGLSGNTTVTIDDKKIDGLYPNDLGSSCAAWDEGKYPGSCDIDTPEDWCSQPWCYVDVDNCVVDSGPYESYYLPDGGYHGGSLYYSYLTCDGTNTYDSLKHKAASPAVKERKAAAGGYGLSECQCVAIEGLSGTITVTIDGTDVPDLYPAEIGSSCTAWDENKYPGSCDTTNPEDWCSQLWCYVDPDNCVVPSGPYESSYLPNADFHGKGLYYSYVTCNGTNSYDN